MHQSGRVFCLGPGAWPAAGWPRGDLHSVTGEAGMTVMLPITELPRCPTGTPNNLCHVWAPHVLLLPLLTHSSWMPFRETKTTTTYQYPNQQPGVINGSSKPLIPQSHAHESHLQPDVLRGSPSPYFCHRALFWISDFTSSCLGSRLPSCPSLAILHRMA